ncbi:hypothetical protein CHS0354_011069 [Potamilus streckersoni]|uniref:E3 ubiquitin-protein ligase Topors n=1 Tax=Potamilus streckersoni TaxID=2493646 RepID=A0AAE0TL10_9BIVA|nr:hypothetical protein CHS0354_011069 [Potamilus streckersoni]
MEGKKSRSKRGQKRRLDIPDDKLRKLTRKNKSTPDVGTAKDAKEKSVENEQGGSTNAEKQSSPKSDRESPEPTCAICLGKLENKSFTDSCFHMFCFVCLLEWSKVKAECPLCKQSFKSIVHNVRSYDDYDQYHVPRPEQRDATELFDRRFRYRTTLTGDHRYVIPHDASLLQQQLELDLLQRPSRWSGALTAHAQFRARRQAATSEFRRRIYQNNLRIMEPRVKRQRDASPGFYHRNPACTHRLLPWLNRELNALLHNHESHVAFVIELIMSLIMRFPIDSEEFFQHVYPFVGRHTRQFMRELLVFARSPYCMTAYDQHVMYEPQADTIESDSDSSSEHSDGNNSDIVILSPSEFPAENMSRNERQHRYDRRTVNIPPNLFGNPTTFLQEPAEEHRFSFEDLTPFLERVRRELEVETAATATSGWDSPTPGPSWFGNSSSSAEPIQVDSSEGASDSEATIPATSPRYDRELERVSSSMLTKEKVRVKKNPHQSQASEDSSSDSSNNECDVEIIGYEKPWLERSPVALMSSDDDVDRSGRNYDENETEVRVKSETKKHKKNKHRTWSDSRSSRSKSSGKHSIGDGSYSRATSSRSSSRSVEKCSKLYSHHKSDAHGYKHKKFSYSNRVSSETCSERHRHKSDKSLLLASASPNSTSSSGTERGSRHISYRCRHRTRSRSSSIEIIEYKERNSKHKRKKKHKKHHKKHKYKKDKHKKMDTARSKDHDVQKILDSDEMITSGQDGLLSAPERGYIYASGEGDKQDHSVMTIPSVVVKVNAGMHGHGSFSEKSSESEKSSNNSGGDSNGDKPSKKTFKKHPSGHKKSSTQTSRMNASLDKTSQDACTKNKEDILDKESSNEENVSEERLANHFVDTSLWTTRYVDFEPGLTNNMDDSIKHANRNKDTFEEPQTLGGSRQELKTDTGVKWTIKVHTSENPGFISYSCETEKSINQNSDDEPSLKESQIREKNLKADTQHSYRKKVSILPGKVVDNSECSRNEIGNSTPISGGDGGENSVQAVGTLHKDLFNHRYTDQWTDEGMGSSACDPYLIQNGINSTKMEITQRAANFCVCNDTTHSKVYQEENTGKELPQKTSTAREPLDQIQTGLCNTYYTSGKAKGISLSADSSVVDVCHTHDTVQEKNFLSAEVHDPNDNLRQQCESGMQGYQYNFNQSKDTFSSEHQQYQMSKDLESMSGDLYEKLGYYAETPRLVEHSYKEPSPYNNSLFSSQVRFNNLMAYHDSDSSSSDKTVDESSSAISPIVSLLTNVGIEQSRKTPENDEESSSSWAKDESSPLAIIYSDASRSVTQSPVSQSCEVSDLLPSAYTTSFSGVRIQNTNKVDGTYTEDSSSRDLLDASLFKTSTGTQLQMSETEIDMKEKNYTQVVSLGSSLPSNNETEVLSTHFEIDSDKEIDELSVEDVLTCAPASDNELALSEPFTASKEQTNEDMHSSKES